MTSSTFFLFFCFLSFVYVLFTFFLFVLCSTKLYMEEIKRILIQRRAGGHLRRCDELRTWRRTIGPDGDRRRGRRGEFGLGALGEKLGDVVIAPQCCVVYGSAPIHVDHIYIHTFYNIKIIQFVHPSLPLPLRLLSFSIYL